jgi:hypothetical protein
MQNSARRIFSANLLRVEYTLSTQFKQDLVRVKIEIFSKKGEHRLFRIYYTSLRKKEGMTTNPKKINAKAGLSGIGQITHLQMHVFNFFLSNHIVRRVFGIPSFQKNGSLPKKNVQSASAI